MAVDTLARTMSGRAIALPAATQLFAATYGVVADGGTDNSVALRAALDAVAVAGSTSANCQFVELILPAGTIRITSPITVGHPLAAVKFRLRGAGRDSTIIQADFFSTAAAPQFTVTGGGGTGAVLYPVIEFGQLKAVYVMNGGSGYASAPTATLTATSGTGASVTCTVSSGAVVSVAVNATGSGYPNMYAGDALIVRGQQTEISDLSVSASASRTAASNGGTAAYPYFTTNNGIRYEPFSSFTETTQLNVLRNVTVTGQPGHGINAARQEQWKVDSVSVSQNGGNGLFLHTQGAAPGSSGISNQLSQLRSRLNGCRGLHIEGMVQTAAIESCIITNLTASQLPAGVNEEVYLNNCNMPVLRIDAERGDGNTGGKDIIRLSGCFAPTISGYLRGGRYGVYCAATRTPLFQGLGHYGNLADVSNSIIFLDGGTGNTALYEPIINGVYNLGNVNIFASRDIASIYSSGFEQGVLRFNGMRGSQFATSQSASYTPNYRDQGSDQIITLTGNVAIANPTLNQNGARLTLVLVQDATGGRTPSFGTAYLGAGSLGSGTANQIGVLELQCVVAAGRTVWVRKSWSGWL